MHGSRLSLLAMGNESVPQLDVVGPHLDKAWTTNGHIWNCGFNVQVEVKRATPRDQMASPAGQYGTAFSRLNPDYNYEPVAYLQLFGSKVDKKLTSRFRFYQ
jgi:hypothetical protein